MPRRVIIPVDGSQHSLRAIAWYKENIYRSDDAVILFYATEGVSLPSVSLKTPMQVPLNEWESIVQAHQAKMAEVEKTATDACTQEGIEHTFETGTNPRPGEAIVEAIQRFNIDLVVMGSRGLGAFRRTFLGSVSDFVLHHCGKPVSIIPAANA